MKNFHCCASCVHYAIKKQNEQTTYMCERLGYTTKPTNKFNCWDPKPQVKKLMQNAKES